MGHRGTWVPQTQERVFRRFHEITCGSRNEPHYSERQSFADRKMLDPHSPKRIGCRRVVGHAVITFLGFALALGACHELGAPKVIRLGHSLDKQHSVHKAMEFMAQRLAEKSNGRVQIRIYPSEQLGSERELVELLQLGSVGMTKVSAAVMESFAPAYKVFSIPYLFENRAHQFDVLDGKIGRDLLVAPQPFLLRGLAYYDSGSRSFYTKARPIEHPDDLTGLKIRVMASATSLKMVAALGGAATPMPFGELYTALQQGVVDGAENNPPSFFLTRHYEVCKYYVLDEHSAIPDLLLIGTQAWDQLTPQERVWLQEAADESVTMQRALWQEAETEAIANAKKAGVEVIVPDKAPFRERVQELHAQYLADPEVGDSVAAIKASAEGFRKQETP